LSKVELQSHPHGVVVPIRAHPGARRNALLGVREGMLRIAVTAAPEKGKANQAIAALLGRELGLAKSSIELIAGETSSHKRFLLIGANRESIDATIDQLLNPA